MESLEAYIFNAGYDTAFALAYEYEKKDQLAGAIEFYLEVADDDKAPTNTKYEALIRAALCYERQGNRNSTVRDLLHHAVSLQPLAKEAHFVMSRHYEWQRLWNESYMHACIGLTLSFNACRKPIPGYVGKSFEFQKAVAAWWIGKTDECRELMYFVYNESRELRDLAFKNLRSVGYPREAFQYTKAKSYKVIDKFPGYSQIERNYAQAAQDLFVLTASNGKRNGTYLEIGCADPIMFNNTYLLEKDFGWKGLSLDIASHHIHKFKCHRSNEAIQADALTFQYTPGPVDYLQVDCEPANVTFDILKRIISHGVDPTIITFEHDRHTYGPSIAAESRDYLTKLGYSLIVKDVRFDNANSPFEDWWVKNGPNVQSLRYVEDVLGIDYILKK